LFGFGISHFVLLLRLLQKPKLGARRLRRHARAFGIGDGKRSTERIGRARRFIDGICFCVRERRTVGCSIITNCRKFSWRSDMRLEDESMSAPKMDEGSHANGFVGGRHALARGRPRQDRYDGASWLHEVGIDREGRRDSCARIEQRRRESELPRLSRSVQNEIQNRNANASGYVKIFARRT
jgi:hypothetical protein